jgi:large subunit ribosomal protein L17
MRHNKAGRTLGRNSSHRRAMLRNMVTSLLDHDRITTTDARAKELRKLAEKMITLGKRGDLHSRRQALQVIQDKKVVAKLFDRIGPRFQERPGGYTRIIKLGARAGDNAALAIIELVEEDFTPRPRKASSPVKAVVAAPAVEDSTESAAETLVPDAEGQAEEKKDN